MSSQIIINKISAKVMIRLSEEALTAITESLLPETETPSSERSSIELESLDGGLMMTFRASDISALRAAMNSYLRWVQGITNMFNVLD